MKSVVNWVERAKGLAYETGNFINGKIVTSKDCGHLDKFSPRDGSLIYCVPNDDGAGTNFAVAAASSSFTDGRWSKMPISRRKDVLFRLAALIEQHGDRLALLEAIDVGKPITDARTFDVSAAAAAFRFNAEAIDKLYGPHYSSTESNLSYQLLRPVGVVAAITGWNFPLVLAASKIAPALAAGNSIILKPSELSSLSSLYLARLAAEAGVPDGVFNMVSGGPRIGASLAAHPAVDLLSFTGSTQVGKKLMIASGQSNMKRLVLECGGKSANIVFDDCPDPDAIADAIVARAFYNQGEVCTASSRLLIQKSVSKRLLESIVERTAMLVPGDPLDPGTRFGALVSKAHAEKIDHFIATGTGDGAVPIFQWNGEVPDTHGFYRGPTILGQIQPDQPLAQQEIFGPVLSVFEFETEEEAIQLANGTDYGLSAIAWTMDPGRAQRLIQRLRVGWTTINSTPQPSGGPDMQLISIGGHKQSGLGIEGGVEGLHDYLTRTAVQWFV